MRRIHTVVALFVVLALAAPAALAVRASPNPFNPRVTIAWSLPVESRVVVRILDGRGRYEDLDLLVEEVLDHGRHRSDRSGVDALGNDDVGVPFAGFNKEVMHRLDGF